MKRLTVVPAILLALAFAVTPTMRAQGLENISILQNPPTSDWPTFNGDYSGRRFSSIAQINQHNV
ncbi:MAG: acido-empty-quinoprotein group A, partial [Candidatus Acidiferrales bacterium]